MLCARELHCVEPHVKWVHFPIDSWYSDQVGSMWGATPLLAGKVLYVSVLIIFNLNNDPIRIFIPISQLMQFNNVNYIKQLPIKQLYAFLKWHLYYLGCYFLILGLENVLQNIKHIKIEAHLNMSWQLAWYLIKNIQIMYHLMKS